MKTKKIIGISSAIGVGATLIATTATLTSCSTVTKNQAAQSDNTNDNIIRINTSLANKIRSAIQNFVTSNGGKITQGENSELAKILNDAFAKEFKGLIQQVDVTLDDNSPALATVKVRINAQSDLSIQTINLSPNSKLSVNDDLKSFDVLDIVTTVNQADFLNLDAVTLTKMNDIIKGWLSKLNNSNNVVDASNDIKRDLNSIISTNTGHFDPVNTVGIDLVHGTFPKQCTVKLSFNERVRYTGNSDFKFIPNTNQTQLISTNRYTTSIDPIPPKESITITQDIAKKITTIIDNAISTLDNIPGTLDPLISLMQLQMEQIPELQGKISSILVSFGNEQPKIADVTVNFTEPVVTNNVTDLATASDFSLLYKCTTKIDPIVVPNSLKITPDLAQKMDTVIQPVVDTMINESNLETIATQIKGQLETIGEIGNLVDKVKVYLLQGYPKKAKVVITFTEVVNTINVDQYSKPVGTAKELETIKNTRINPNPPTVEPTSFEIDQSLSEQIYSQMNSDIQVLVTSMNFDKQQLINVFKAYLNKTKIGKYVKDINVVLTSDQPAKAKVSIKFTKDVYLINVNKFVWDSTRQISATFNTNVNRPEQSIVIQGNVSNQMKTKVEVGIGSLTDPAQIPTVQETIKTQLNAIPEISNKVVSVGIQLGNESPAKATVSIKFTNDVIAYNLTQFNVHDNRTFTTIVQTTLNPPPPKVVIDKDQGELIYATIKNAVENETTELTTDANLSAILTERLNNISLLKNKISKITVKLTGNAPKVADITMDFNEDVETINTGYFIKNSARQLNLRVATNVGLTFIFNRYLAQTVQKAVDQTINELNALPPSVDVPLNDIKKRIQAIPELMNKVSDVKLRFNDDTPKKAIVDIAFNCDVETRDANNFVRAGRVLTYTKETKIGAYFLIDASIAKQIYDVVDNILGNLTTETNPVDVQEKIKRTLNNAVVPIKNLVSDVKVDFNNDIPKKANVAITFNTNIQTQNADNWNRPGKANTIMTTITTKIGKKFLITNATAKVMKDKIDGLVSKLTALPANSDELIQQVKDALNSIQELQNSVSSLNIEFSYDEPKNATVTIDFDKVPVLEGQNIFTILSNTSLSYTTPTQISPKITLDYQTALSMQRFIDSKLTGLIDFPNANQIAAIQSELLGSFNGLKPIANKVANVSIDFDNGHPKNATVQVTFLNSVNTVNNGIFTNISNTTLSYSVKTGIDNIIEVTKDVGDLMKAEIDKVIDPLTKDVVGVELDKLNEEIKVRLNAIAGIKDKVASVVLTFNKQTIPFTATVAINFNGQVNNGGSQYFTTASNTQLTYTRLTNINNYFVITQPISNAIASTVSLYLQDLTSDSQLDQITKDNIANALNQNPLINNQIQEIIFKIDQNTRPKVINVDIRFKNQIKLLDQSHCVIVDSNTIRYTVTTKIDPILHINQNQAASMKSTADLKLNDIEKLAPNELQVKEVELLKEFNKVKGLENKVSAVNISLTNSKPKNAKVLVTFTDYIQMDNNNVLTKTADKQAEMIVKTNIDAILEIDAQTARAIRNLVEKQVANLTQRPSDLVNKEYQQAIKDDLNAYPAINNKVTTVLLRYNDNFPQGYTANIKFDHQIRLVDQSQVQYVSGYEISVSGDTKINEKFDLNPQLATSMYNKLYTMCNQLTSLNQINDQLLTQIKDAMNNEFTNNKVIQVTQSTDQSEPRNITLNLKFNTQVNAVGQDKFSLVDKFTVAVTLPTSIFVKTYTDGTFIYKDKLLTHAIDIEQSKANITDLYVPRNIRKLDAGVLNKFTNLFNIDMSDSILTDLPSNLFNPQNHIVGLKLPRNLQTMQPGCLNNLTSLESITWPKTLSRAQLKQGIGNATIYVPNSDFAETNKTNVDGTPRNAITKTADYAGQKIVLIGNDINMIGAWEQKNQNYGPKFLFNGNSNGVVSVLFQELADNNRNDFIISRGTFNNMLDLKRVKLPINLTVALDNTFNTLFNMEHLESDNGFAQLEHLYASMFNTMPLIKKLDFSNAYKMENTSMSSDFSALASLETLKLPNQWNRLYGGGSFAYLNSIKKISMPKNDKFDPGLSTKLNYVNESDAQADFNVNFPRTPICVISPKWEPFLFWDDNFESPQQWYYNYVQVLWVNGWVNQVGWDSNYHDHSDRASRALFTMYPTLSYLAISGQHGAMESIGRIVGNDWGLEEILVPFSTVRFYAEAIFGSSISKLYIPENVTVFKDRAFLDSWILNKLVILRESGPQWLEAGDAFGNTPNLSYNNIFSNYKITWRNVVGSPNDTNPLYYGSNRIPYDRITTNASNAANINYANLFDGDANTQAIIDIPSYTNGYVEFNLNANRAINIGTIKYTDSPGGNQNSNPYSAFLYAQVEGEWVLVGSAACWWGTMNDGGWVKQFFPNDIWSSKFKLVLKAYDGVNQLRFGGIQFGG